MGIKDEGKDKDELKNLVENSVEKKLKEFSKDTEKNREKDKKEILKELKQRDEKGLNTLAQKFEMLKLKAEQANKKQSKNPLVELSDKNLKWLSEHALANQKPEDMGKGLAQNIVKTFTKSHGNEEKEGTTPLGTLPMAPQEDESASNEILKSKMSMEEKIDEIHKFVTKGILKEQKNSSNILSKGLDGLTKGMKATQKVLKDIGDKTKQLAMLVTMGALGLLAIVGWWKEGGPDKLMKGIVDGVIPAVTEMGKSIIKNVVNAIKNQNFNEDGLNTAETQAEQSYNNISNPNINAKTEVNTLEKMYNLSKDNKTTMGSITQGNYGDKNGYFTNRTINDAIKAGKLDAGTGELLKNDIGHTIQDKTRTYSNSKGAARLSFPVAVEIIDIKASGQKDKGSSITIKKAEKTAGFREGETRIVVTNVIKLLVPEHRKVPKNTTIAIIGAGGEIIGDLDAFMRGAEFDDYMDKHSMDSTVADQNLLDFRNEKGTQNALQKSYDDNINSANIHKEREELKNNPLKYGQKVADTLGGDKKEEQQEVPKADVTQVSENKNKLNEQSKELMIQQGERDLLDSASGGTQSQGQQSQTPQRGTIVQGSTPNEAKRPEEFKSLDGVLPGRKTIGP